MNFIMKNALKGNRFKDVGKWYVAAFGMRKSPVRSWASLLITRKVNDNSEGSSVKFIPETPGCKQAVYILG